MPGLCFTVVFIPRMAWIYREPRMIDAMHGCGKIR